MMRDNETPLERRVKRIGVWLAVLVVPCFILLAVQLRWAAAVYAIAWLSLQFARLAVKALDWDRREREIALAAYIGDEEWANIVRALLDEEEEDGKRTPFESGDDHLGGDGASW